MGGCVSYKDKKSVLQLVRGLRPREQSLGNARLVGHMNLWDEYERTGEILGSGLNGQVVRIVSKRNSSLEFALKELVLNVKDELLVCLELDHANIARVFEVYESPGSVFLVVELCRGGELFNRLKQVGRFNEVEATYLIAQILRAVNYMHSLDIIHGDLKLENFLLSSSSPKEISVFKQVVKLIDFGFSHRHNKPNGKKYFRGSIQYMAPEKLFDGKESEKSDIWSVGVIAFMLITGQGLVDSEIDTLKKELTSPEWSETRVVAVVKSLGASADAIDFLLSCLRIDPLQRCTAREALAHRWLRGMTVKRISSKLSLVTETEKILKLLVEFSKLGALKRASLGLIALVSSTPLVLVPTAPAVFDLIDSNSDGFIQEYELIHIFEAYQIPIPLDFFSSLDLSGDQRINYSEFLAATEVYSNVVSTAGRLSPLYRAIISSVFRKLDCDNSGFISEKNLRSLFGQDGFMGRSNSQMLREGDFYGDGVISESEFFSLITED